jgi:hypothetical protein
MIVLLTNEWLLHHPRCSHTLPTARTRFGERERLKRLSALSARTSQSIKHSSAYLLTLKVTLLPVTLSGSEGSSSCGIPDHADTAQQKFKLCASAALRFNRLFLPH